MKARSSFAVKNLPGFNRRLMTCAILASIFSPVSAQLVSEPQDAKFVIDADAVKTLKDLIREMKAAAGPLLPPSIPLAEYYQAISKAFVENAHAAAAAGIRGIPPAILEKIPRRRVVFPILVVVAIAGVTFLVPLSTLVWAVVGSLGVLTLYIYKAIDALKRETPIRT
jgi:hypothetical protein